MKKGVKLSENWDVEYINNKIQFVEGAEYAKQNLKQVLQVFRDEYFLDKREGIPYIQNIFKKGISDEMVKQIFKNRILQLDYIKNIYYIKVFRDNETRTATIKIKAKLTNDEEIIEDFQL